MLILYPVTQLILLSAVSSLFIFFFGAFMLQLIKLREEVSIFQFLFFSLVLLFLIKFIFKIRSGSYIHFSREVFT